DLLGAGFGAVGDAGDIHNDGFVNFVDRILHGGQRDRAGGAARRDDNRGSGAGVITRQGGCAGEGQVDRHGLRGDGGQGGGDVGGRIIDRNRFTAGGRQRHGKVGIGGSTVALDDDHIIDRERRKRIVVEDGVGVGGD